MTDKDEGSGLELRLPWGKPDHHLASSAAPSPETNGFSTGPSDAPSAPPPEPPAVQALQELVQDRADRIDNRLNIICAALPELVGQLRADLTAQQVATSEALGGRTDGGLVEGLDRKIDAVARDLTVRLEALEMLILAGYSTTMTAISELMSTSPTVPLPAAPSADPAAPSVDPEPENDRGAPASGDDEAALGPAAAGHQRQQRATDDEDDARFDEWDQVVGAGPGQVASAAGTSSDLAVVGDLDRGVAALTLTEDAAVGLSSSGCGKQDEHHASDE